MRAFLPLFLLFLKTSAATAQEGCRYFSHKYEAETLAAREQPDSAVTAWRAAFSVHMKDLSDLLTAANLAFRIDSLDAAREFLTPTPALGLNWEQYLSYARHAGRGKIDPETFMNRDEWDMLYGFFSGQINQNLRERLRRLAERDQQYRADGAEDDAKMHEADSLNALELRLIVGELGRLPGYYDIGAPGLDDLELLFIHMGFDDLQFFMPHLAAAIRNGEYFANEELAYQIDRISISTGDALYIDEQDRLQKGPRMPFLTPYASYSSVGVWYEFNPADGKRIAWPVFPGLGEAQVNASRERLCLDSLGQCRRRMPWIEYVEFENFKKIFGIR